jgi:hypothetical protein
MLNEEDKYRFSQIVKGLDGVEANRQRYSIWRDALHLYEDVVRRKDFDSTAESSEEFSSLFDLANRAFTALGGRAEPNGKTLADYDADRFGPFLGVSDEGKAAERVRDAFLNSPKMKVFGIGEPIIVGASLDAERLGGAGEVPVGPDEYRKIQLACMGRNLTTTNIGTRVNVRYYNDPPKAAIGGGDVDKAIADGLAKLKTVIHPFLNPPDDIARGFFAYVCFVEARPHEEQVRILKTLHEKIAKEKNWNKELHQLALCVLLTETKGAADEIRKSMAVAHDAQHKVLAVEGVLRREAQERVSMPVLLNWFDKTTANALLSEAATKGITLRPWKRMDLDSVARTIWASLQIARSMGLNLGKYGLLPLTLEEVDYIIGRIQEWFPTWTAAPAIYIDCPMVNHDRIYDADDAAEGVLAWLKVAKKHNVKVVLIDTADKSLNRRLLKMDENDARGIFTPTQLRAIDGYARNAGIKALWAGGIEVEQAFDFGELEVFGIYTTTSTARMIAVSGDYSHDPSMANMKEPTYRGVYQVKLLLEGGFVAKQLKKLRNPALAETITKHANALIAERQKKGTQGKTSADAVDEKYETVLAKAVIDGWEFLRSAWSVDHATAIAKEKR